MYFPLLKLHGWRKRSAAQPQTICSEFPQIFMNRIRPRVSSVRPTKKGTPTVGIRKGDLSGEGLIAYPKPAAKAAVFGTANSS